MGRLVDPADLAQGEVPMVVRRARPQEEVPEAMTAARAGTARVKERAKGKATARANEGIEALIARCRLCSYSLFATTRPIARSSRGRSEIEFGIRFAEKR